MTNKEKIMWLWEEMDTILCNATGPKEYEALCEKVARNKYRLEETLNKMEGE